MIRFSSVVTLSSEQLRDIADRLDALAIVLFTAKGESTLGGSIGDISIGDFTIPLISDIDTVIGEAVVLEDWVGFRVRSE